jgi:dihydrofolate reductase
MILVVVVAVVVVVRFQAQYSVDGMVFGRRMFKMVGHADSRGCRTQITVIRRRRPHMQPERVHGSAMLPK